MATKKNIKKTKKITIPAGCLIVDITDAKEARDVYEAFAYAKLDKHITHDEFVALTNDIISTYGVTLVFEQPKKKQNIFKRFWNWLTK